MKSIPRQLIAALALIIGPWACVLPSHAQGYYISPSSYSNMYAVNAAQLAQNLQFAARMKQLKDVQATLESTSRAVREKEQAPPAPFSATDFKPTGRRDAPQRLAAQVADPALRPQITQMAREILAAIEQQPKFRRNNLAYAFMVYLGGSLQVLSGQEFDDARSEALARWINEEMVSAGAVAKLNAAQRTQLYDVLLLQGGLIIGMAQAGIENQDEEQVEIARNMARDALDTFGISL